MADQPGERYRILVEFAYKHLDFLMPELISILDMYDIELNGPDGRCIIEPLPNSDNGNQTPGTEDRPERREMDEAQKEDIEDPSDHHPLKRARRATESESEKVASTSRSAGEQHVATSAPRKKRCVKFNKGTRPFVILSFPESDEKILSGNGTMSDKWNQAKSDVPAAVSSSSTPPIGIAEMLSRCTLVKSVIELWGCAPNLDECAIDAERFCKKSPLGRKIFERVSKELSWKVTIHTLGTKYTRAEQDNMRKKFSYLGFEGPVNLSAPDCEYVYMREIEMDGIGSPVFPRHHKGKTLIPENDALPPLGCYFGRVLGGTRGKGRGGLEQYNLKHRVFLGPTSMDAELSFVMTSLGQVRKGSIVFDPFVGTGSILVSCALRGAYCIGADIDIRILRGNSPDENIATNFAQFQLPPPELLRVDNSIYDRHFRSHEPLYDAIICDPPYGIRAGARRTGSRSDDPRPILEEFRHDHIAQTKPYAVSDVMADLLDMAARTLVMHGRLVYVIPSYATEFDPDADLPRHDCLKRVHSCYQPLSAELGRRIVAMKKVQEYDLLRQSEYMSSIWVNGPESADKCANIREKLIEAAKKKPGYEEKAAIRKQKRKAHKEAKKKAKLAAKEAEETAPMAADPSAIQT